MRIVVLGGAGMMGCIATQELAVKPVVDEVVIADLDPERADRVVHAIQSSKLSWLQVDARDRSALVSALAGADACLNATVYYFNLAVMDACLAAGCHYVDLGGLFHTTRQQLERHAAFEAAGITAVLGMGSAPGVPNVHSRYAADRLDRIDSIRIYDGIKPPPPDDVTFSYAVATIIDEMTLPPMVYRSGDFVACQPLSEFEDYWFTPPLGLLPVHLSLHSEVATLPHSFDDKGIQECFFKINYWGMAPASVEKVKALADLGFASPEPVTVRGTEVVPRDLLVALMGRHLPPISSFLAPPTVQPPEWTKEIVTEVHGARDGQPVTYRLGTLTVKGALPTGLAPALAAQYLAEGRVRPGVYPPEQAIDPVPFFQDLEARGIPTQVSLTEWV